MLNFCNIIILYLLNQNMALPIMGNLHDAQVRVYE